jgi:hypothetical protein
MKRWVSTLPLQVVCDAQMQGKAYTIPCKLLLQVFAINEWNPLIVNE